MAGKYYHNFGLFAIFYNKYLFFKSVIIRVSDYLPFLNTYIYFCNPMILCESVLAIEAISKLVPVLSFYSFKLNFKNFKRRLHICQHINGNVDGEAKCINQILNIEKWKCNTIIVQHVLH